MPLEVVVDGPLGQSSQIVNDVLEGGVLISLFHKQLRGDRQDLFHRLLRVLVSGHTGPPLYTYHQYVLFIPCLTSPVKAVFRKKH